MEVRKLGVKVKERGERERYRERAERAKRRINSVNRNDCTNIRKLTHSLVKWTRH